ncbi:MAG: TonB-dependent receptor [Verrucomicrobia bacterium]|nr:TonB-dependent receptor [Verrucomicrobiota bacterium]
MKLFNPRDLIVSIGMACSAIVLSAQNPPAAPAPDEVITLNAFSVNSERATGYRAASAITATGIGAKIMDVPIPINVMTGELIRDMSGQSQSEILSYVPGVTTNPRYESHIMIRGFNGLIAYRNGQYRRQLYPTWNIDRIEVIKGSSAVFFGVVRPGGLVNYLTRKPEIGVNTAEVKVTAGSWSFLKGELYFDQTIGDNAAFRFGAGGIDSKGYRTDYYRKEHYFGGTLLFKPTSKTRITIDLEKVGKKNTDLESSANAVSNSAYLFNPNVPAGVSARTYLNSIGLTAAPTYNIFAPIFGGDDPYGRKYIMGKGVYSAYKSTTLDFDLAQVITDNIAYQMSANWARDDFMGLRSIGGDQEPFADGTLRFRFGNFGNIRDTYNLNNRLVFKFDFAGAKNTLQLGQEWLRVFQLTPGVFDSASRFQDGRYGLFQNFNPRTDAKRDAQTEIVESFGIERDRRDIQTGYYFVNHMEYAGGNLHLLYGIRRNEITHDIYYTRTVTNPEAHAVAKKWTPQVGALYKVIPGISLFATYSTSIEGQFSVDADGKTAKPVEGKGYDAGIKTELLDGRLVSTFTVYDIKRTEIASRDTARETATGRQPWFTYGDTEQSQGLELDVSYNPTATWQTLAGYSHSFKSKIIESTTPTRIGRPLAGFPQDMLTLWTRYDFGGQRAKGFFIGGGGRFYSASNQSPDPNFVMKTPGFGVCDLLLGYKLRLESHREWNIQVNVKNVFDKLYRDTAPLALYTTWGDPRSFYVSGSTRF